jgi:hypothetical protein
MCVCNESWNRIIWSMLLLSERHGKIHPGPRREVVVKCIFIFISTFILSPHHRRVQSNLCSKKKMKMWSNHFSRSVKCHICAGEGKVIWCRFCRAEMVASEWSCKCRIHDATRERWNAECDFYCRLLNFKDPFYCCFLFILMGTYATVVKGVVVVNWDILFIFSYYPVYYYSSLSLTLLLFCGVKYTRTSSASKWTTRPTREKKRRREK